MPLCANQVLCLVVAVVARASVAMNAGPQAEQRRQLRLTSYQLNRLKHSQYYRNLLRVQLLPRECI